MDERQDIEKKDKNIAQLMVELTTVQAQIKLVKAAIFMDKQKAAISTKMKDFKAYAEGQAEKYSQNMEEANEAMETYKSAVEEAMQQYEDDYLDIMAEQDEWQNMEIDKMGEQKELSSAIKEKRKTPEYKEWKQEVKNMNREIKAAANDPEKLVKLAEELKQLQAKDPTLPEQQKLESVKNDRIAISEIIKDNDERLVEIKKDRDDKLSELLESKETALAKLEKQSFWQRVVGALTPKAKKFKTNVVDKIAEKATEIKDEKIPQIIEERKAKREERIVKMAEFKEKVGDKLVDAKDVTISATKKEIKSVIEFGREAKKTTIKAIKGIGAKAVETKDKVKEGLRTAVEKSSQTLEDLNDAR